MFPTDNNFESEFTFENSAVPIADEPPFHILLLGDWSGNQNRKSFDERRPIVVDRDNLDEVIKRLNVAVQLDWDDNQVLLKFEEFDDFHPDNLYRKVPIFSELRDLRSRLLDSDTFNAAANQVRSWLSPEDSNLNQIENNPVNKDPIPVAATDLLDLILTQPSDAPNSYVAENTELAGLVSNLVAPHLIRIDEHEQSKFVAAVDNAIAEMMRKILHHPKFQNLESVWRGLFFLVRRLETNSNLKIFIFDVSKDEIVADLKQVDNLSDSSLYRCLSSKEHSNTANADSFAIIGGIYSFGLNVDDIATLIRIAKIGSSFNTHFTTYVKPELYGFSDFSENFDHSQFRMSDDSTEFKLWSALRAVPEANYLSLIPMKILSRLPYGQATDPVETFDFEEFIESTKYKKFLWMNPVFVPILLLAQSFQSYGWDMENHLQKEINNLPLYTFYEHDTTKTTPCAEVVLTEAMLETLLAHGFMPLVSFRDTDKVRIPVFQSVSSENPKLSGQWDLR